MKAARREALDARNVPSHRTPKERIDDRRVSRTERDETGAVERRACRDRRDHAATVRAGHVPGRKSSPVWSQTRTPHVGAARAASWPRLRRNRSRYKATGPTPRPHRRRTSEATKPAGPQRHAFRLSGRNARGTTRTCVDAACASPSHALPGGVRPQVFGRWYRRRDAPGATFRARYGCSSYHPCIRGQRSRDSGSSTMRLLPDKFGWGATGFASASRKRHPKSALAEPAAPEDQAVSSHSTRSAVTSVRART